MFYSLLTPFLSSENLAIVSAECSLKCKMNGIDISFRRIQNRSLKNLIKLSPVKASLALAGCQNNIDCPIKNDFQNFVLKKE